MSRVQTRIALKKVFFFTWYHGGELKDKLVAFNPTSNDGTSSLFTHGDEELGEGYGTGFSHMGWLTCQLTEEKLFQLECGTFNCRLLQIFAHL